MFTFQRHLKAYHVKAYHVTTSDSRNHNMAVCIAVIAKEVMIYQFFIQIGDLSISCYICIYLIRLSCDVPFRKIFVVLNCAPKAERQS